MDRRGFLKGALGTLSAAVGAFALGKGVDARETMPEGVPGTSVDATLPAMAFSGAHWPAGTMPTHHDAMVSLERPWRIVNDPHYSGYDPRAGEPESAFPEYDARYPIERAATLDGWWDYTVRDGATNASAGFYDPYLRYATNDIADQELTARALYVEHLAHLHGGAESPMIVPVQLVSGTSVTRATYRQATPFTTEQMVQLRDAHRALPNALNAVVASGPKEDGMFTVRVLCEIGGGDAEG